MNILSLLLPITIFIVAFSNVESGVQYQLQNSMCLTEYVALEECKATNEQVCDGDDTVGFCFPWEGKYTKKLK